MKLSTVLLALVTVSSIKSEENSQKQSALQLQRLGIFRRSQNSDTNSKKDYSNSQIVPQKDKLLQDFEMLTNIENAYDKKIKKFERKILINAEAMKRIDELATTAYKLFNDPHYEAMIQERIKRSGSGDFVSGIAGKVISGVVGASTSLSGGLSGLSGSSGSSAPQAHDSYGVPVEPYEKPFSIWDFKKAILNTLIQALKALAGGAIAFKGHLIKGGGFLVQTTGRVISSAGDAASSLGAQLASSAVITVPKPGYDSTGYYYPHPEQEYTYDGPPPSPHADITDQDYHQGHRGSSSDNNNNNDNKEEQEAGLLIIKPMKDENSNDHEHFYSNTVENLVNPEIRPSSDGPSSVPESNHLTQSQNSNSITKLIGFVTGTSGPLQTHQNNNDHIEYLLPEHKGNKPIQLEAQNDFPQVPIQPPSSDYDKHNYYQQTNEQYSSQTVENNNIQQSQSLLNQPAYHGIQELLDPHLRLPTINSAGTFKSQGSNYVIESSLQPLIKIPILDHHNALDAGNFESSNLPVGYGVPLNYGFDSVTNYNWKRSLMMPHGRKSVKRNVINKYNNYRNRKYPHYASRLF